MVDIWWTSLNKISNWDVRAYLFKKKKLFLHILNKREEFIFESEHKNMPADHKLKTPWLRANMKYNALFIFCFMIKCIPTEFDLCF